MSSNKNNTYRMVATNSVHPEPTTPYPAIRAASHFDKLVVDEIRVGESGFKGRLKNIGRILRASCVGLVECATCCCCCFGCMGNGKAHSGMVKYDEDDIYAAMPSDAKRVTHVNEHVAACMLCSPVSCCTLLCCFGCCGSCGPVGTSTALMAVAPK